MEISKKVISLMQKGVSIPNPYTIDISDDIDINRISGKGVTLYSGCKLFGATTFIDKGAKIGYEGPVTVKNCHVGMNVELNGGFFRKAVFLKNVKFGSGAHVREGTILEEEASAAHTVGLKQTILFPFVTLGSLINFCDCMMAGGKSKKNHSEVGSSYIHFNYTPDQHKATASIIGDVPNGVMLKKNPIFLGGQGGLVGPCRLSYGTTVAAGTICRKDELRPDRLIFGGAKKEGNIKYTMGLFQGSSRIIKNNINYIGNLLALMQWYRNIRSQFISKEFPKELYEGLQEKLEIGINERIQRFEEFYLHQNANDIHEKWSEFKNRLNEKRQFTGESKYLEPFIESINKQIQSSGNEYITVITSLSRNDANVGTQWLSSIVEHITDDSENILLKK